MIQTIQPDDFLIVDSTSDDATQEIAREYGVDLWVIAREDFNHGATRHEALMRTTGDYVLFMTQDAIPANDHLVENLLNAIEFDQEIAMVTGRQLPKADARRFEQLVREYNYPSCSNIRTFDDISRMGIKAFFASDVCSIYRRDAYLKSGGFPRPIATNEDMLMAALFLQAGYKVAYEASACVFHSHNMTLREQYARNRLSGTVISQNVNLLQGVESTSEGMKMVKSIMKRLAHERAYPEMLAFALDCTARYLGNRNGTKADV